MIETDIEKLPIGSSYQRIYTIYALVNRENGKRYIGRTIHPRLRLRNHFSTLNNHKHQNPFLNKDSNCRFGYEILEENVPWKDRRIKEQEYMVKYKTYDPQYGYNINDWGMRRYKRELQAQ